MKTMFFKLSIYSFWVIMFLSGFFYFSEPCPQPTIEYNYGYGRYFHFISICSQEQVELPLLCLKFGLIVFTISLLAYSIISEKILDKQ